MKHTFYLIAFILVSSLGFSQNIEVKGKVLDATTGIPLPSVNIKTKNSKQGSISDVDGNFKISNVTSGTKLVFSYIGYSNYELTITGSQNLTIKLQEDKKALDEVVVVGYSSKKKKDVTGSVTVISAKTIDDLRPIKAEQALQGTVAGVVVSQQSGAPGAGLDIRIRGISTNANNGPLVIIDGYEGQLELLNPSDIDSFSVLKDAQASIYGARGGNGVILVTTKTGKKNSKTKISFNSYTGFQETTKKLSVLNATEYALLLNESYANGGLPIPYQNINSITESTDWQNEVFKRAPIINNDISVSGGSDKITYSVSAANINQEGIVGLKKSGFDRTNFRIGLGADLSDKWKLQTNFIYTDFNRKSFNENGVGSVLFNAVNVPSILTPRDTNGNFTLIPSTTGYGIEVINPLAQIEDTNNDYNLKKLSGTVKLDFLAFKGFKLTSRIGFNTSNSSERKFSKEISYGSDKVFNNTRSFVNQNNFTLKDYTFDLFGEYETKLFENNKIKWLVGTNAYQKQATGLYTTGYDVPYNSWEYADINLAVGTSATGNRDVGAYSTIYRIKSLFTTLDYDYKGRYLLSGIFRLDGATAFGPENSVALFKSILGGWIVSEEPFFRDNKFINFLKLRASYGELGNDNSDDTFKYRSLLKGEATYVFNNELVNGVAVGTIPNKNIKWEADKKLDFGLDINLLKNKLEIIADYFIDTRQNLLIRDVPVSGINGANAPGGAFPTANVGTVKNAGLELALKYKGKTSKNFNYTLGFNATKLKNEVLEVNNGTQYTEAGDFGVGQSLRPTRMVVGQPIGVFYGYQTDGIFQNQAEVNAHPSQIALGTAASPGDIRFKDINGDGIIDAKDRTYLGKPIADYTLGFNLNLNYKNFDFIAYSYASIGNQLIRNYERTQANLNKLNYVLDRWAGEGTSNSVPRVTAGASANNVFSDYFVEDASFLRIQNIQLGYSINGNIIDKIGISKVRLYASVSNLYTFTKYKGFDPAANSGDPIKGGIDYGFYPTPKTYVFGINLNF
jgi:TonB-dependent starch-binding outer membrane protein SusC